MSIDTNVEARPDVDLVGSDFSAGDFTSTKPTLTSGTNQDGHPM